MSENNNPDLPPEFFDWLKSKRAEINTPVLTSLLYDINLLPEQVMTFKDRKSMAYLVAVVEHFSTAVASASKSARVMQARKDAEIARGTRWPGESQDADAKRVEISNRLRADADKLERGEGK